MSRIYVNRSDRTSDYMTKVKPIEGFEDFGAHGTPDELDLLGDKWRRDNINR